MSGRIPISPENTSPPASPDRGRRRAPRMSYGATADAGADQNRLLEAIESGEVIDVRAALSQIPSVNRKAVLLSPSRLLVHKLQTPLMVAAASGDMSIMAAILAAFDGIFMEAEEEVFVGYVSGPPRNLNQATKQKRTTEMKRQMEIVDIDDMTLLMHASASGSSSVFHAVADQVQPSQFRNLLPAKDAKGMNFLHHAVNAKTDTIGPAAPTEGDPAQGSAPIFPASIPPQSTGDGSIGSLPAAGSTAAEDGTTASSAGAGPNDSAAAAATAAEAVGVASTMRTLDPWVPVVKHVVKFARKSLWLPQFRQLLLDRDAWNRSILEHSIISGRQQVFETTFQALRRDIHDEKLDIMMDGGIESSYEMSALRVAVASVRGQLMPKVVAEKAKSLQRDVSLRTEASTLASKIQTFIPGNLVIIFQLLLPEFKEKSDEPLVLLLILCAIAPFWAWGATMNTSRDPHRKYTIARNTTAKYILAAPAMFFWGVGTSKIGTFSLGWAESASAAALAVATIVIPALDSYCSGKGARSTKAAILFAFLNLKDRIERRMTRNTNGLGTEYDSYNGWNARERTIRHTSMGDRFRPAEHGADDFEAAMEDGRTDVSAEAGAVQGSPSRRSPQSSRSANAIWLDEE